MTDIYKRVEPKEGEYVQFVGVHVLAWRQHWGKPTDAFIEDEETEKELTQSKTRIEALEGVVELVKVCVSHLVYLNMDGGFTCVGCDVQDTGTTLIHAPSCNIRNLLDALKQPEEV